MLSDHAHLVLEQELDGFHQFESEFLRKASDIMMGLDSVALEDVGIDRSLTEELDALDLPRLLLEDGDELGADDLPLLLGVGDPLQFAEETVRGVHVDEIGVHLVAEHVDDLLRLSLAQESVVDVHAGEVLSNRFD